MRFQVLGAALALAATAVNAQSAKQCTSSGDVCFTVNVPTDGKDLFFQISGPSSMTWIGLGQGSAMSGSNIFAIYANAAGNNVTLSPRQGTGHSMPSASTSASVTLLDGSMVTSDKMIANVKCSNCQSWSGGSMDFKSSSTNWIYAYQAGSPLKTDNVAATINRHDEYQQFSLDLTTATGGDGTVNPFTTGVASTSPSANPGSSLSNNTNSITNGSDAGVGSDSSSTSMDSKVIMNATTAHGFLGAIAFLLLFPSGSIIMRVFHFQHVLRVHIGIQVFGYLVALTLMETGVWIAVSNGGGEIMMVHPIMGLVVVCGLFFQPFLGWAHHRLYVRDGKGPNVLTYLHIWWGRILITVGIVNGYFGLILAGNNMGIKLAYATLAGLIWVLWMGLSLLTWMRGRKEKKPEKPTIVRMKDYERY